MGGDKLYHIVNWREQYENSESRRYDRLRWVPIPNKFEGKGIALVRREDDAPELYAAWVMIVALASKAFPKERRGYLEDDDGPLSAEDMALITGFPKEMFERALDFYTSGRMHWLEVVEGEQYDTPGALPESSRSAPGTGVEDSPQAPGRDEENPSLNRTERNRIEQKKKQGASRKPKQTGRRQLSLKYPDDFPEVFRTEKLKKTWENFKVHRQRLRKPMTPYAEELMMAKLMALSRERADLAIRILDQSIEGGWQKLYELKNVQGGSTSHTKQKRTPQLRWDLDTEYGKCECGGGFYQRYDAGGDTDSEVLCRECLAEWKPNGSFKRMNLSEITGAITKGA